MVNLLIGWKEAVQVDWLELEHDPELEAWLRRVEARQRAARARKEKAALERAGKLNSSAPPPGEDEPESLCWSCLRAGWDCLCEWPPALPAGAQVVEWRHGDEMLYVVAECPWYWPE